MNVKEAAQTAKSYITDLFADEEIVNVGLEEVQLDEMGRVWKVTIGFLRPWDRRNNPLSVAFGEPKERTYKVVRLKDKDGSVISMTDRMIASN